MLTQRQRQICSYIDQYVRDHGSAPSLDEIRLHLGIRSVSTVHKHIRSLEERGVVRKIPGRARGIELVDSLTRSPDPFLMVPVLDDVRPPHIEERDQVEDLRMVPVWLLPDQYSAERHDRDDSVPQHSLFLFEQKNQSMQDHGIDRGDWVVFEIAASKPRDFDRRLAVISVDNLGSIIRYVAYKKDHIIVEAGTEAIQTFALAPDRVEIYGWAVARLCRGQEC